jgi:plastocyanin
MIIMEPKKAFSIICVITLLAISIFAAGCADIKPEPYIEDTATPTATATATPNATATETPEPTEVTPTSTAVPQEFLIRIMSYMFIPTGDKEINVGDTIKWRNFENTKKPRYLVNENGIWEEEQYLRYMGSVSHTFNETGEYTFYLKGRDTKILTITVV